jgi:hypothetical protein
MTKTIMFSLIVAYIIIGSVALCERKPWLALYWVAAAALINYSVIRGMG